MAFLMVYIGEAHPSDAWQVASNLRDRVIVASPASAEAREAVASTCVARLALELPAVVDGLDDATEKAYTGWPERLYLIDRNGRVAYKSRPGPYGFKLKELEHAISALAGALV